MHLVSRGAEASPADGDGAQPLHLAAGSGHLAVAMHLVSWVAEASPADGDGAQPLDVAVSQGHLPPPYSKTGS